MQDVTSFNINTRIHIHARSSHLVLYLSSLSFSRLRPVNAVKERTEDLVQLPTLKALDTAWNNEGNEASHLESMRLH